MMRDYVFDLSVFFVKDFFNKSALTLRSFVKTLSDKAIYILKWIFIKIKREAFVQEHVIVLVFKVNMTHKDEVSRCQMERNK